MHEPVIDLHEPPTPSQDFDDIEHELSSSWREACGGYSAFSTSSVEAAASFLAGQGPSGRAGRVWSPPAS